MSFASIRWALFGTARFDYGIEASRSIISAFVCRRTPKSRPTRRAAFSMRRVEAENAESAEKGNIFEIKLPKAIAETAEVRFKWRRSASKIDSDWTEMLAPRGDRSGEAMGRRRLRLGRRQAVDLRRAEGRFADRLRD